MSNTTDKGAGPFVERRVAVKLREAIDAAIAELRRLGAADDEIQAFLSRRRAHWQAS